MSDTPEIQNGDQELPDFTGRFAFETSYVRVLPEGTTEEEYRVIAQAVSDELRSLQEAGQIIDGQMIGGLIEDGDAFLHHVALGQLQRMLESGGLVVGPESGDDVSVPGLQLGEFPV